MSIARVNPNILPTRANELKINSYSNPIAQFSKNIFNKIYQTYDYTFAKNPVTQKRQIWFVPFWLEKMIGQSVYYNMIQEQGGESFNQRYQELVEKVGKKLSQQANREMDYEFAVIRSRQVNAWALPGGKIAIYEGLIKQFEDETINDGYKNLTLEDKLAAVLSHEITHSDARHTAQRIEKMCLANIFLLAIKFLNVFQKNDFEIKLNQDTTIKIDREKLDKITHFFSKIFMNLYFLASSRSHEYEADKYGMHLMKKSGYNLQASLFLQELFMKRAIKLPSLIQYIFNWINTHPQSELRLEANKKTLKELEMGS
jgi:predicted Zn-dependent protease